MNREILLKNIYNKIRDSYLEYLLKSYRYSDVVSIIKKIPDREERFTTCFFALFIYARTNIAKYYSREDVGNTIVYKKVNYSKREIPEKIELTENKDGSLSGLENLLDFMSTHNPVFKYFSTLLQEHECTSNLI